MAMGVLFSDSTPRGSNDKGSDMLADVMKAIDILTGDPSPKTVEAVWAYVSNQSTEWKDLFHSLK